MKNALDPDAPVTWGRMTMCEAEAPSHAFVEEPGKLRLQLRGEALADLAAEGSRALGCRMYGPARPGPSGDWIEVEIQAGGREAVLAKWLNRLLDMAERNRWAPVECQVSEANDVRLRARVRGVPIPRPPGLRNAVIQLDSISAHGTRGIQAEVSLEAEPAP